MYYESGYKNQNFKLDEDFWTQGEVRFEAC